MYANSDRRLKQLAIYERLLDGVASSGLPFMVKGSYLHCRCFPRPLERLLLSDGPDFVALTPYWGSLKEVTRDALQSVAAETRIDEVLQLILEILASERSDAGAAEDQGRKTSVAVSRQIISEDDFSTLRVALTHDREKYVLDFAVNLSLYEQPVSLVYKPVWGSPFTLPYAASMEAQVAWKLHQCLIRTRAKDLVDLIYMLGDVDFSDEVRLYAVLKTVLGECQEYAHADALVGRLRSLFSLDTGFIHLQLKKKKDQAYFRRSAESYRQFLAHPEGDVVGSLLSQFEAALRENLEHAHWRDAMEEIVEKRDYLSIAIEL